MDSLIKFIKKPVLNEDDMLHQMFLSFFFGIYFLFLFIVRTNGVVTEQGEWQIYILGWLVVPVATIAAVLLIEFIKEKFFNKNSFFYPIILASSAIYFLVAVWHIRLSHPVFAQHPPFSYVLKFLSLQAPSFESGKFLNAPVPKPILTAIAWLYPFYNLFIIFLIGAVRSLIKAQKGERIVKQTCFGLSAVVSGLGLINYAGITVENYKIALSAFIFGLIFLCHKRIINFEFLPRFEKPINAAFVILLAFLVFDPAFSINHPHQNPVLAPVSDMMLGKSLLVDTNCQYGVLLVYFLRTFFSIIPMSYQGLTLLSMVLFFIQYGIVYNLLKFIIKSPLFSLVAMFLIILANYFATLGGEIAAYPSLGPLRFCLSYILLFVVMVRLKRPGAQKMCRMMERVILALVSIWSFEALFYTMAMYTAVLLFEAFTESKSFRDGLLTILERTGIIFIFMVAAHFLLYWSIYLYSGQFPQWSYYLDYIFLYSTGGWGGMPIAPWSPWLFFALIPFLMLMYLAFQVLEGALKKDPALKIVAGLTFLSIAQFSYFVGRSHPNNLFHVSVPVLMIAAYGIAVLAKKSGETTKWFYSGLMYGCYFAMFYLLFSLTPAMLNKLKIRLPHYSRIAQNYTRSPTRPETAEAIALINKYFKDKKRIGIFIEEDAMTETLMLSRKLHVMPLNYPRQEDICPTARERVFDATSLFKEDDIILASKDCGEFQERILSKLQGQFKFSVLETTPEQIFVIQLRR